MSILRACGFFCVSGGYMAAIIELPHCIERLAQSLAKKLKAWHALLGQI